FAKKHKSWTKSEWRKVIFSNETKINHLKFFLFVVDCVIFSFFYLIFAKKKARSISIQESENEIKETLEDYVYHVQEVKRLHKMLSNSDDVVKILKDSDIQIGYSMVKVEHSTKTNHVQSRISSNAENTTD
ncbi:hypothetical protein RFI_01221, partial [Reticulomyxa filosa]